MGSVELKAGDFVVRTNEVKRGIAVFLGNDEYGNYVVRYSNQTRPMFIATKYPETLFRFANGDEIAGAAVNGTLPSMMRCPKNPHYRAVETKAREEQFSPLVETSAFTCDEAKGFLPG